MTAGRLCKWWGLLVGLALLVGCSGYADEKFEPFIQDDANVLSRETKRWLETYAYPRGFAFAIRSVRTLNPATIGVAADQAFAMTAERHPNKDAFGARGVLLLVSHKPALIQVRVGRELYSLAQWGGITAGPGYIEAQQVAVRGALNKATQGMVIRISSKIPQVTNIPWYKKFLLQDIVSTLNMELDALSLPSDGFYGHYLLRPLINLRIIERHFAGSWWIAYIVIGVCIFLFKILVKKLVVQGINTFTRPAIGNSVGIVLSFSFALLLTIPAAGSAIHLSGSRLEDQIALHASGLPAALAHVFEPGLFAKPTGLWIALLIVGMRVLTGLASRGWMAGFANLSEGKQKQAFKILQEESPIAGFLIKASGIREGAIISSDEKTFTSSPFTTAYVMPVVDDVKAGIRWGLLAGIFLPLALSLVIVYSWVIPICFGIYETVKSVIRSRG